MKTSVFGLVLLLVLCVTLPADAQPEDVKHRYQNFLRQHVYLDMAVAKCNSVMGVKDRDITVEKDGKQYCKETNTFIKANSKRVKSVCGKATAQYTSGQPFPLVTCKLHSGERPPDCEYKKGHKSTRYIIINCDKGWPVHYAGDRIDRPTERANV